MISFFCVFAVLLPVSHAVGFMLPVANAVEFMPPGSPAVEPVEAGGSGEGDSTGGEEARGELRELSAASKTPWYGRTWTRTPERTVPDAPGRS